MPESIRYNQIIRGFLR